MSQFQLYSQYYDLLYQDKNYKAETDFVLSLFKTHTLPINSILELGCGTGIHAQYLSENGFLVHGVDLSESMLTEANKRSKANSLNFSHGDVRSIRVNRKFDAVLSLFHVMSYQTSNEDILSAFKTAAEHLDTGGLFVFDVWYGPAVLTDRPEVREKRLENDQISIIRQAKPDLYPERNVVDVNYFIEVKDKKSNYIEKIQEKHSMRYFFSPEIQSFLAQNNMKLIRSMEWMTGAVPSFKTWGVVFLAQKL